jgi:tRNA nucleotidyltransferase (CCA-adding enzyme)
MLLIVTHENADFDAVASQLAAHKLYPEGVPLLSWRVNRNVEQFLALYWDAFDFVRPADWRRRRVETVILVDTPYLPSVRGLRSDRVDVLVFDHHEASEGYDQAWDYRTEPVGATTTLLVEMLRENGLNLSAIEATLLLLGIHEDTGSLLYDSTTSRDAQAAAWLMEKGGQLTIVRRFLDIPLSAKQQQLYEGLLESVEWVNVEGQSVALATVEAPEDFEDEISAVAHRLRDALSPDGLVLLVDLKHNHVQLVARATTDHVDVSLIARRFGGGGHSRAAAATIMDQGLDDVYRQISGLLPAAVTPMARVSQIMSHGVQTLTSDSSVFSAAELMQRFGHEGYPVVDSEDGRLVGLLSRRMVDRAVSHKLGQLPVAQIMKAGNVTIRPSDSVEQVQRLMIQEGWGQIPVVADDREGGGSAALSGSAALIGVVTRTDLINLLTDADSDSEEPDMRQLMSRYLPEALWGMVGVVGDVADELDMPLYFVGGLVRDLLLRKRAIDIDMVVEGDAINLVRRLRRKFGGETRSHAQFGTAKWLISDKIWQQVAPDAQYDDLPLALDFVTARTEFYSRPSALPEVTRGSIKLDLHRRDFTINTLAVRLDGPYLGQLLDFYGGRRDLEMGKVRVLHSLSFVDDPTRILRAARLEQRLEFSIEERTLELLTAALPMLDRVTGDRIRNELEMCLREARRAAIMRRLAEFGVLAQIHPGLSWHKQADECFRRADEALTDRLWEGVLGDESPAFVYFALLLLPLTETVQVEILSRLKVRKTTRDDVLVVKDLMSALAQVPLEAKPSQVVQVLRAYPPRVLLTAVAAVGPNSPKGKLIDQYQREWRDVRPELNGNDLLEMGLEAGPQIGRLLDRVLATRLDGEVRDKAGERALIDRLIEEEGLPRA